MNKIAIYNPYLETRGGGEKVCLALAEALSLKASNKVYLITHSKIDLADLGKYFDLDLSKVSVLPIKPDGKVTRLIHKLPIPGRIKNLFHDIKIYRTIKRGGYDTFINNCYQSNLPNPSPKGVYMCMFPQKIRSNDEKSSLKKAYILISGLLYRLVLHPTKKHAIYTYPIITANSSFTQKYIKKYWGLESKILYPICDNMKTSRSQEKKKIILNVGRFFENVGENHHKRQDILLSSFKEMPNLIEEGWELHFAGSVAESAGTLKYLLQLMKDASNLPVYFHYNCSFQELKKLYNDASIYWHATGYGSDPTLHPEKQEHFGISTVEAMSTGCIPVVINSAGQRETVKNGETGYLWKNISELKKYSLEVARYSDSERKDLSRMAIESSKQFNKSAFRELVDGLL